MNKVPYVTKAIHGPYPVGSNCLVSRSEDLLTLEFEDGKKIELEGEYWYAEGLEEPRKFIIDEQSIVAMIAKDICKEIDEEIFAQLDKAMEKINE